MSQENYDKLNYKGEAFNEIPASECMVIIYLKNDAGAIITGGDEPNLNGIIWYFKNINPDINNKKSLKDLFRSFYNFDTRNSGESSDQGATLKPTGNTLHLEKYRNSPVDDFLDIKKFKKMDTTLNHSINLQAQNSLIFGVNFDNVSGGTLYKRLRLGAHYQEGTEKKVIGIGTETLSASINDQISIGFEIYVR